MSVSGGVHMWCGQWRCWSVVSGNQLVSISWGYVGRWQRVYVVWSVAVLVSGQWSVAVGGEWQWQSVVLSINQLGQCRSVAVCICGVVSGGVGQWSVVSGSRW